MAEGRIQEHVMFWHLLVSQRFDFISKKYYKSTRALWSNDEKRGSGHSCLVLWAESKLRRRQSETKFDWKTYGSNTRRVMYSLGMRGSWWEKTFCSPTSHIRIFLLDFWESELPMTWNSIMPLRSSRRAVSSRAAFADRRLVWWRKKKKPPRNHPVITVI